MVVMTSASAITHRVRRTLPAPARSDRGTSYACQQRHDGCSPCRASCDKSSIAGGGTVTRLFWQPGFSISRKPSRKAKVTRARTSQAVTGNFRHYEFVVEDPRPIVLIPDTELAREYAPTGTKAPEASGKAWKDDSHDNDRSCTDDSQVSVTPSSTLFTPFSPTKASGLHPAVARGVQFCSIAHRFDAMFERCMYDSEVVLQFFKPVPPVSNRL